MVQVIGTADTGTLKSRLQARSIILYKARMSGSQYRAAVIDLYQILPRVFGAPCILAMLKPSAFATMQTIIHHTISLCSSMSSTTAWLCASAILPSSSSAYQHSYEQAASIGFPCKASFDAMSAVSLQTRAHSLSR